MLEVKNSQVLCSIQCTLQGYIIPNLRGVFVDKKPDVLRLFFYYDKSPSEDELELASLVHTEFLSDFPSPEYTTDCEIKTLEYPKKFPEHWRCVYLRYEPKDIEEYLHYYGK